MRNSHCELRSMKKHEFRIVDGGLINIVAPPRNQQSTQRRTHGFTLLEIIIVITILSVLTAAAVPMVRNSVKRERESELRLALRQLRQAIDRYKQFHDQSTAQRFPSNGKPRAGIQRSSKLLVEGFVPANVVGTSENRVRFLRRLPIDPMTGDTEWGLRAYKDKPDSTSWGGEDVFDVYSKSNGEAHERNEV